jgi:hypothetical protein
LILDEMEIGSISAEDRKFLEESFICCEHLGLNKTQLKSLDNLPTNDTIRRVRTCLTPRSWS